MPRPFPNTSRRQQGAVSRIQKILPATSVVRTVRAVARLASQAKTPVNELRQRIEQLLRISKELDAPTITRALQNRLRDLSGKVADKQAAAIADEVLSLAGPIGRVARRDAQTTSDVIRRRRDAVKASEALLKLAGALVGDIPPEQSGGRQIEADIRQSRTSSPEIELPPNTQFVPPNKIRIRTVDFSRTYPLNHPAITGKMVPVSSSNVHAIGFIMNYNDPTRSRLLVQYHAPEPSGKPRSRPGPTYEYYLVRPEKFERFLEVSSKGGFVWDELRVRGSRVLHRHKYSLKKLTSSYLPRRATIRNGREMLVKRTRMTKPRFPGDKPRKLVSPLPEQDLGPAKYPGRARPNRGRPNRGR